jgi:aspartate racemase
MKRTLGILGGMGPLATVDFMRKVIDLTPATRDQDHIPMVVASIPQVPDRTAAILGDGESPLPVMLDAIRLLNLAAVDAVAIPCNTAHYSSHRRCRMRGP